MLPKTNVKQEILQNLLRTILLKIQSHATKEDKEVDAELKVLFIRFQRMLADQISLTRNANDYCTFLNVSYRELNTACKTLTNKTVKVFIDDVLILEAKRYLSERENNISQTAYLLGFDEVTNFTKFFKKHTSLSPKAFIDLAK
jgi:AraC-like DNA-binding protein